MASKMQIERVPISSLHLDPSNVRIHPDKNLSAIKGSLQKFGQQKPIVIGEHNIVIAGNGTLEAAKALGWDTIDVIKTELKGSNATAYALADNRTTDMSEWDDEGLQITLKALFDEDFDLESIGFDSDEFNFEGDKKGLTDEDEVPDVKETNVKRGDIYSLGAHRLMCGDSTDSGAIDLLMNGEKADITFTSPPYNAGKFEPSGKVLEKFREDNNKKLPKMTQKYANDDDFKSESEYQSFLEKVVEIALNYSETAMINVGIIEGCKRSVIGILGKFSANFKDIVYWNKKSSTPHIVQGIMTMIVEPIFCFGNSSRKFPHAKFKGNFSNLIEGHNAAKDNKFAGNHSATFPVYLPEIIANNFSEKTVLDLFMGTGTTLIACEKTNRKCYGMEIDPHYCQVIIDRWQNYTGKKAIKADGKG